jgi:hypothetical protein
LVVVTMKSVCAVLLFFIFLNFLSSASLTLNTKSIHDFYQKVKNYFHFFLPLMRFDLNCQVGSRPRAKRQAFRQFLFRPPSNSLRAA